LLKQKIATDINNIKFIHFKLLALYFQYNNSLLLLVQYDCSIAIYHQQVTSVVDMMSVVRWFVWVLFMTITVRVRGKSAVLSGG